MGFGGCWGLGWGWEGREGGRLFGCLEGGGGWGWGKRSGRYGGGGRGVGKGDLVLIKWIGGEVEKEKEERGGGENES